MLCAHLIVIFSETIKFTRLETRTKESHLHARIRENKTLIRNESEIINYYPKKYLGAIMT